MQVAKIVHVYFYQWKYFTGDVKTQNIIGMQYVIQITGSPLTRCHLDFVLLSDHDL